MFLQKLTSVSNASRNIAKITSKWYDKSTVNRLAYRKKSTGGRSSITGRVVVWTKSSILRRIRLPKINYTSRNWTPKLVSSFKLVPFSNKLLALAVFSSGELTYLPAITTSRVFSLLTSRWWGCGMRMPRKSLYFGLIYRAPMFRKISNLEVRPGLGSQYVRAAGCSGRIIRRDKVTHAALVILPSGVRKFFSFYATVALGACALKEKRKTANTKSGHWRSYGLKPKVRGVARNPVDHPHGGRTKAIRYPRTPWGKTTKFK